MVASDFTLSAFRAVGPMAPPRMTRVARRQPLTLLAYRLATALARPAAGMLLNRRLKEVPPPFVAEGRDMGTAVFPEAAHKFYLTASPEVRAWRRARERPQAYEEVLRDLLRRDERDKAQSAPAPDALVLDTGGMTLDEVVAWVLAHIRR